MLVKHDDSVRRDDLIDGSALGELKRQFEAISPDFETFSRPGTGAVQKELDRKRKASHEVRQAVDASNDDTQTLGKKVIDSLKSAGTMGYHWQKRVIEKPDIATIIGNLVQSDHSTEKALSQAHASLKDLHERKTINLSYAGRLTLVCSAFSMVRTDAVAPVSKEKINEAGKMLTGESLFEETRDFASDYHRFSEVFSELFRVMRDDWEWEPRDWLDVQEFLRIALSKEAKEAKSLSAPDSSKAEPAKTENLILFGPPGTGKTYSTAKEAIRLCGEQVPEEPDDWMEKYKRLRAEGWIEFVTFHQSMSYEDFVEGRQPETDSDEDNSSSGGFRLKTVPGIFRNIVKRAEDNRRKSVVLIIDEINRANISKVFGELITLLEPDKRLGKRNELRVRLPYSEDEFGVPSNLHIVATMNTADRSIALLDTALRRRFRFKEMMPDAKQLKKIVADWDDARPLDLETILNTLNERIEYLYDREHQIGHAYFMECTSKDDVDAVMRDKVIPLLAEYFYEDWGKVAAVLGDAALRDGEEGGFFKRLDLKAPPGVENDYVQKRSRWELRSNFDYKQLMSE